jgi:hypothetical protein
MWFLDTSGKCTSHYYYRKFKNYKLVSKGIISEDCNLQSTLIRYDWFKDNQEVLTVITSNQKKAMFLRRPDNDSCLAAYLVMNNNSAYSVGVTTHWLVDDFQYLYRRYMDGDPVTASGNGNNTSDFIKGYIRDFPETLLFPMKNKKNWNTIVPDISAWLTIPKFDKEILNTKWNSSDFTKVTSMLAHLLADEYMTDPGYWSPAFNAIGDNCPGLGRETAIY